MERCNRTASVRTHFRKWMTTLLELQLMGMYDVACYPDGAIPFVEIIKMETPGYHFQQIKLFW
jgi:hypothetical protein